MTNDYSEFLKLKEPQNNTIYKYEIYNGECSDDAQTYELFSIRFIEKEEWGDMLMKLFKDGCDARQAYRKLLETSTFFKLEDLINIKLVAESTIGMEFSTENEWEHPNPDACFRKKFCEYADGTIEYYQDYLEI